MSQNPDRKSTPCWLLPHWSPDYWPQVVFPTHQKPAAFPESIHSLHIVFILTPLSLKFWQFLLNPHFKWMPLLIILTKLLEAIRRVLPQAPTTHPSAPWPTPVGTTHASPFLRWMLCELKDNSSIHDQIKEIFQQLFHLPSMELFPISSKMGVRGWKENFSLWPFSLQLGLHFSVPLYSNFWEEFSIFAVSNFTSLTVSGLTLILIYCCTPQKLASPGDQKPLLC